MFLLPTVIFQLQGTDAFQIIVGIILIEVFAYIFVYVIGILLALVVGFLLTIRLISKSILNIWS